MRVDVPAWWARFGKDAVAATTALALACLLWLLQWQYAPNWLVRSSAGLQTLLQVVPPTIAGVFALGLASIFVIAQTLAPSRGARAVGVLLLDGRVRLMLSCAILLVLAGLLLSGTVTDHPMAWLTSAAATVAEVGCAFVVGATLTLASLLHQYTSPTGFSRLLLRRAGSTPHSFQRTARNLRQWMRAAARNGESRDLNVAADGLVELFRAYAVACEREPSLRRCELDIDNPDERRVVIKPEPTGWFGEELSRALVRPAEDGLRSNALWRDLNRITATLDELVHEAVKRGLVEDVVPLLRGLAEIGLFASQHGADERTLWYVRPAVTLAALEGFLEHAKLSEEDRQNLAGLALAGWALVTSELHDSQTPHEQTPAFLASMPRLGGSPPWDRAAELARDRALQPRWRIRPPTLNADLDDLLIAARAAARLRPSTRDSAEQTARSSKEMGLT